jgi:hypothetical protein
MEVAKAQNWAVEPQGKKSLKIDYYSILLPIDDTM